MRWVLLVLALAGCDQAGAPATDVHSPTPAGADQAQEPAKSLSALAESEMPSSTLEATTPATTSSLPLTSPRLDATATPTADELLLLRDAGEAAWIGLLRTPAAPSYVYCDVLTPTDLPRVHLDLIQGSIHQSTRSLDGWDQRTCEIARVDARFDREAHGIARRRTSGRPCSRPPALRAGAMAP